MAEEKRRYRAKLGDREFTIVGKSSIAHMEAVAEVLNEQLAQIEKLAPKLSKEDQALLLAYNSISDQLKKQVEMDNILDKKNQPIE